MLIFEDPRGREFTPKIIKKHQKSAKKHARNRVVFLYGINEDLGTFLGAKIQKSPKCGPRPLQSLSRASFFFNFSRFRRAF